MKITHKIKIWQRVVWCSQRCKLKNKANLFCLSCQKQLFLMFQFGVVFLKNNDISKVFWMTFGKVSFKLFCSVFFEKLSDKRRRFKMKSEFWNGKGFLLPTFDVYTLSLKTSSNIFNIKCWTMSFLPTIIIINGKFKGPPFKIKESKISYFILNWIFITLN